VIYSHAEAGKDYMRGNLIPMVLSLDFKDPQCFLEARNKLLQEKLKEILGHLFLA
jgi:hypothetical protein